MADTIISRVARNAAAHPDRTFCHFLSDQTHCAMSWADLMADVNRFASALVAAGVGASDPVIIMLPHHRALYSSFLGAMAVGAVPSFLPLPSHKQRADLYWHEQRSLFARIEARAVIVTAPAAADLRDHAGLGQLTVLDADIVLAGAPAPSRHAFAASPETVAFLQHSSGTTGLKKGVALSHGAVLNQAHRYGAMIEWEASEVVVSWLPLYHDMGLVATFLMPAILGGTIVAIDPFEWVARPSMQLDAVQRYGGTRAWLPNFAFLHLARQAGAGAQWQLSSMKSWINCSEPCKSAAFGAFLKRFRDSGVTRESLQVTYAMAETVFAISHATKARALDVDRSVLSCGRVLPGTQVRISEAGEILVRSESLFGGYYLLPDQTAEKLVDGWLHTGDLGFIRDGELYVSGRTDDLIVVCGRNYFAHHIEAIAAEAAGVVPGRVVAFRQFNDASGTHDVVVAAETDGQAAAVAVQRAIKQRVNDAIGLLLPQVIVVPRGTLIKTTSGKISRRHNADLFKRDRTDREVA